MTNYYIEDNGEVRVLKFNKLKEFEDKVELVFTFNTYGNGFKFEDDFDVRKTKFIKVSKYLNINSLDIVLPKQTHTDCLKCIKNVSKTNLIDVDGLITDIKNIPLATTFADCTPLFFYDPIQNVIANVHSGWVGTTKKIGLKAVQTLINVYDCKPKNILCFIGPCIRKDHFLVNDDCKNIFEEVFKDFINKYNIIEFTDKFNEKGRQYSIDTTLINKILLKDIGILEENIFDSELCTMCNSDKFHSRRAEGINYEANTGIMFLK